MLSSNILLPEGLCKESFIDSKGNCVAVQLAALMKPSLDNIEQEIDQLYTEMTRDSAGQYEVDGIKRSWREMGVSSKIIAQLGVNHGMNVYVLSQGRKIASYKHDKKGKRACLCFTVDSDHAWFYESEAVRRSISHTNIRQNRPTQTVAHDFQSTRAEYRTWKPYTSSMKDPGCFDTDDIENVRLCFLENNISPKVSYSNGQIVALHVPLYKQHIYKTPMYASSLLRWSDELSRIGYHVPYLGEGIASFTHNVVLALVKNKRKKVSRAERFSILENTTIVVLYAETKGMHSAINWNWTTRCL